MSRHVSAPDAGCRPVLVPGAGPGLIRVLWVIVATIGLWPGMTMAKTTYCDDAARHAAAATGVPLDVLRAITRVETGRARGGAFAPWPWTVNLQGKGYWFDTEEAALGFVQRAYRQGARSFDVGCFQINVKWHGEAFASLDQMLDPVQNALYAARFLQSLKTPASSWSRAAGAYHSRTAQYARVYRGRFDRQHAELIHGSDAGPPPRGGAPASRGAGNGFPLLRVGGASGGIGSLVRLDPAGARHGDALQARARPFISMVCDTCQHSH